MNGGNHTPRAQGLRRVAAHWSRTAVLVAGIALALPAPGAEPAARWEFHGYIRTGLGLSADGTTQADFQAPGAPTRYRLGNEAHTNFEFAVDYRYDLSGSDAPDGAFIQGYYMFDDFEPYSESDELGLDHTAQAYIKFGGYLAPGVDLWLGRRYYDRKFISMARYHWLNPGQNAEAGVGIEGWRLGPGTLNAALFRTEDPRVESAVEGDDVSGTINGTLLDLRYAKLPGLRKGETTLWATLAQRARHEALDLPARSGYGLGLWHDLPLAGGANVTALLHREGAAIAQGVTNPNPVREDQGYDLTDAATWEINNSLLAEPGGRYAFQWAVMLRRTDFGRRGTAGSTLDWYSSGVRPIYYLTNHVNVAVEASVDYVDDTFHDRAGDVRKLTLALQLSRARSYTSTPVFRVFVTRASWSDDFRGLVGNTPGDAPYGDDTDGWTLGTQVEAVW